MKGKFYYGADLVDHLTQFQSPINNRTLITQNSSSSLKRKTNKSEQSVKSEIKEWRVNSTSRQQTEPQRTKMSRSVVKIERVRTENCDSEQCFAQSLQARNQSSLRPFAFKRRLLTQNTTLKSYSDLDRSMRHLSMPSQSIIRYEMQKEMKDRKQIDYNHRVAENKLIQYKIALAVNLVDQLTQKDNKIEFDELINCDIKQVSFMHIYSNLINLPLNLKGLEQACKSQKFMMLLIKPSINHIIEPFVMETSGSFKKLTIRSQLFTLLMYQSDLFEDKNQIKISSETTRSFSSYLEQLEKLFQQYPTHTEIVNLCDSFLDGKYDYTLMVAKEYYNIKIDFDFIKHLFCFCNKVQEALLFKGQQMAQAKEPYDRNYDFKKATSQIKCQNLIQNNSLIFRRPQLYKPVVLNAILNFESKFGQLDVVPYIARQRANFADLKSEYLYQRPKNEAEQ